MALGQLDINMIQIVDITQLSANKESSCLDSVHAHDAFFIGKYQAKKCQEGNFKEQTSVKEKHNLSSRLSQSDRQDSKNW